MTQRQVAHQVTLPACAQGHAVRHVHDLRRPEAGGGHLLECECRQTAKYACVGDALRQWRRMNAKRRAAIRRSEPAAPAAQPAPATLAGILQFPLAFVRGSGA
ncbi:hypothetical protein [Lysobacter firmicutimachus]|uniref:Uncharacterized protein n=1 Tax=Lysobacter firmicutimachus TaxID=1792846 RepID=A0ABU8D1I6_9GAMM